MKKQYIIPIFIPSISNLNDYIFGNLISIKEQVKQINKEDVKKIIEEHLKYVKEGSKVEIGFFGGSFGELDEEKQKELLLEAYEYIKLGKTDSIRISVKPNNINKKFLKRLKKYKVKTIELEVQSSNDYILKKSGNDYTFDDVKKASRLIRLHGFTLGHQMMVGLPESTNLDEINTAKQLIKLKPQMVRIYPVLVIKNTKLEKDYNEGKYKALTLVQAVETCKELVKLFAKKNIEVIRIGNQSADTTNESVIEKSKVVARTISSSI